MARPDVPRFVLVSCVLAVFPTIAACGDSDSTPISPSEAEAAARGDDGLDRRLRRRMQRHGVEKPTTIAPVDEDVFKLGKKLFFDKALSGPKDTACASCHFTSPGASTSDGLPLGVGVGGVGSIPNRRVGPGKQHEPRHSIELINRGLEGWTTQFWDARVQ
ncbi:MAG: cytochrome c peroxidase, partial [Bradymonadaceae bacterium]